MKQVGLPSDVQQMLRAARALDPVSNEARDRLASRLDASLGIAALGSMGAGAADVATKAGAKSAVASALTGKVAIAVVAFSLGGAAGVLGHAALTRQAPAHEPEVALAPIASAPPPEVLATPPTPETPIAPVVPPPRHRAPRVSAPAIDPLAEVAEEPSELAAESRQLDEARAALARRDLAGARASLEGHEASFPSGRLSEEREALRVRLLWLSGDVAAARAAASAFLARYPDSLSRPAIEALVD